MTDKATKAQASYQTEPKGGERCDKCTMFRLRHSCTAVAGLIVPHGWCRFYEATRKTRLEGAQI